MKRRCLISVLILLMSINCFGDRMANGKTRLLSPYVFRDDLIEPQSGDDVFLFDVLKTSFIKEKYADAAIALERLLRTNMTRSVTMRSSFYLGECYYFMGQYEQAIKKFLAAESSDVQDEKRYGLSRLCGIWIDSSLDLMWSSASPSSE